MSRKKSLKDQDLYVKPQKIDFCYDEQLSSPQRSSTAIIDHENQEPSEIKKHRQYVEEVNYSDQEPSTNNIQLIKVQPVVVDNASEKNNIQIRETDNHDKKTKNKYGTRIKKTKDQPIVFDVNDIIDENQINSMNTDGNKKIEQIEQKKQTIETSYQSSIIQKQRVINREQIQKELCQSYQLTSRYDQSQSKRSIFSTDKSEEFYYYESENTQNNQSEGNQEQEQDDSKEKGKEVEEMRSNKPKANLKIVQKTFQADSLEDLLFNQIPENCSVECLVICRKHVLSTSRSYDLYLKNQKRYLITAIKNRVKLTSTFEFKHNPYKNYEAETLATLQSNFSGLEYTFTIKKSQQIPHTAQIFHLQFLPNLLGLSHRSLCITQNRQKKKIRIPDIAPFSSIKNFLQTEKNPRHLAYFTKFCERKPTKNMKGEFEMDYGGVAKFPSPNNLVVQDEQNKPLLIVGKASQQIYAVKISSQKNGLSIGEGFAIAVSNLDYKLFVR